MHFIPNATLRVSSQIIASRYILERHLSVNNSTDSLIWALGLKANRLYYCGDLETADPHACIDRRVFPANSLHSYNVGLMLGQHRRCWSYIKTALGECLVGVSEYLLTSLSAQSWQYCDRRRPYFFRMTSRVLYSAQYQSRYCTLQAFVQFGALYKTSMTHIRPGRDSNPVPQPD